MRCDEFEMRLQDLLDERRDPAGDAALAEHAAGCADCRGLQASLRLALAGLSRLAAPQASAELGVRVLSAVAEAADSASPQYGQIVELPPRRAVASAPIWAWAAAAVVLLALYPAWRLFGPGERPQAPPVAVTPKPTEQLVSAPPVKAPVVVDHLAPPDITPDEPLPTLSELAAESRGSYDRLARETKRSLDDTLALASLWDEAGDDPRTSGATESDWLRGIAGGVAPIADSTLSTFNALRGVVPGEAERQL